MSTNLQDYIELLTAEQHVQVDKLRDSARNGVSPRVRGEVWMYLLGVLSSDKTSEMTLLKSLRVSYATLPSTLPTDITSLVLKTALGHHTRRFENPTYESLITALTAETMGRAVSSPPSLAPTRSSTLAVPSSSSAAAAAVSMVLPPPLASPSMSGSAPSMPPPLSLDETPETLAIALRGHGFLPPPPSAPPSRHAYLTLIEEVLGKYWNAAGQPTVDRCMTGGVAVAKPGGWRAGDLPAPADWVYLCTPFVCCLSRPVAVYYGFEKLMERMKSFPALPSRLGTLLTLFRLALPDLHSYFEDEQVPMYTVAVSWLTTLLAREMWLGDVLRLWDAYLAADDMFALHCYVCIAILVTCKETLEELDGSEAKLMLLDLPPLDVDRLLQDAANLKVTFALPGPVDDA